MRLTATQRELLLHSLNAGGMVSVVTRNGTEGVRAARAARALRAAGLLEFVQHNHSTDVKRGRVTTYLESVYRLTDTGRRAAWELDTERSSRREV